MSLSPPSPKPASNGVAKGARKAIALKDFTDYGSNPNGDEGGGVSLTASHTAGCASKSGKSAALDS